MGRLIVFEIEKILQKKLIWATLASMVLLIVLMVWNWVCPGQIYVQLVQDGRIVSLEHDKGSMQINRAISNEFAGPLTDEKLAEIIVRYDWTEEQILERGLEPARETLYFHNSLYDSLKEQFASADGSYNGRSAADAYGSLTGGMVLGYSEGWESMNYALINTIMIWECVIIILISPLFGEEYTRGTDALILTGAHGRTKCSTAKLAAAFIMVLGGTLILLLAFLLPFLIYYGISGWDASVQISTLGIYTSTPYLMNWLEITLFLLFLCVTSALTVTAITFLVSALSRSAFNSLVISFAITVIPMFLPINKFPLPLQLFTLLQPIMQPRTFIWANYGKLWGELNVMWLAAPFTLIVLAVGVVCSKRAFARHQVL